MSLIEKFSKVRNCKELFIANSSSYKTRIRQCWFYFFKFPSLHAFPFLRFDEKEKKMWNANAVFFFLTGLCKTLNRPAQKAKSRGGILVVPALYRTVLTVEICSQYNPPPPPPPFRPPPQKKKKKKEEKKKKNNGGRLESFANDYVLM